jgi:hypothetical protein
VLRALAAEPTANSTILAARIGVAPATVRKSLSAMRRKLGVAGGDVIRVARERGFISQMSAAPTDDTEAGAANTRDRS